MKSKSLTYFKGGTFIERLLRFLNLLEPGHMVLSLSKLSMWATATLVTYVLMYLPGQLSAVLGALGAFTGATGNYMYRRYEQYSNGNDPYPFSQGNYNIQEEPYE